MESLEVQLRLLEKRMSVVERALNDRSLSVKEAAKMLGINPETVRVRIREAIAHPDISSLVEGVHFDTSGKNWKILNFEAFKRAMKENDIKFKRIKY